MIRTILAVVAGIVLAFAVTFVTELVWQQLAPMPSGTPAVDPAAVAAFIETVPITALLVVLLGWTAAIFAGTFAASRLARRGQWPGWIVLALFLAATGSNFFMIRHPVWYVIAAVVLILAAGLLGSRAGVGRRASTRPDAA